MLRLILVLFLIVAPSAMARAALIEETFTDPALPGWKQHFSAGNSLTLRDSKLLIRARTHTYAHLSCELRSDGFAASTTIELLSGDPGLSWCPSLMVYWDVNNWAKIGLDQNNAIHALWLIEGGYEEILDQKAIGGQATGVRIEVARGCVRFLFRRAGAEWQLYTVLPRPKPWSDVPSRLIVGKAFSMISQNAAQPDGDNDYSTPGEFAEALIGPVTIEKLSPDRDHASDQEQRLIQAAFEDVVGEQILSRQGEPSFEAVAALFPAIKHSRVSTGVPEHPDEVIVFGDGRVQLDKLTLSLAVGGEPFGARPQDTVRTLAEGWMPIHTAAYRVGDVVYRETVFGMSAEGRADAPLTAYIKAQSENVGSAQSESEIRLQCEPQASVPGPFHSDLGPHETAETHVACAFRGGQPRAIAKAEFDSQLQHAMAMWRKWMTPSAVIEVPERRVTDGYKAWLAYNFLNVDLVGGLYCPHDGCGFYEEVYGQTVAVYIEALDLYGYHDAAERYLNTLIAWQRPDGELFGSYHSFFEHGMMLDAFCKHYFLSGDRKWLVRAAPAVNAAARFIVGERLKTLRQRSDARPGTLPGLLPPSKPYCDFAEPTVSLVTDAWCCAALEKAVRVLLAAGEVEEAKCLGAEAADYRKRIHQVARESITTSTSNGLPALKLEPLTGRILRQSGGTAKDYYSMYGCGILESGFFKPDDEVAKVVTGFLQHGGGLNAGVVRFAGGIDHAYSSGYLLTMLHRDEVRCVLLGFYAFLAYGMTRDTYSGVEVTMFRTGENQPTLPHLASGAHQLRLLRCMLVDERDDELRLLPAAPHAWLDDPAGIRVERICTYFGDVSFRVKREGDELRATVQVQTRAKGRRIVLRPPLPPGRRLRHAVVNGTRVAIRGDALVLPWAEKLEVRAVCK